MEKSAELGAASLVPLKTERSPTVGPDRGDRKGNKGKGGRASAAAGDAGDDGSRRRRRLLSGRKVGGRASPPRRVSNVSERTRCESRRLWRSTTC